MEIKNVRLLKFFKINAIVLYPFVLYCDKKPPDEVVTHEHVHLSQIKKDGVIFFYYQYLKQYFQGRYRGLSHYEAYRNISYEKEAYDSARAT